jgi:hypothetical protein
MTQEEAANTFLYLNPAVAGSKDKWAVDTVRSAKNHPGKTIWVDTIRDSKGKGHTATLVRIGRHVFVSGPGLNP